MSESEITRIARELIATADHILAMTDDELLGDPTEAGGTGEAFTPTIIVKES